MVRDGKFDMGIKIRIFPLEAMDLLNVAKP